MRSRGTAQLLVLRAEAPNALHPSVRQRSLRTVRGSARASHSQRRERNPCTRLPTLSLVPVRMGRVHPMRPGVKRHAQHLLVWPRGQPATSRRSLCTRLPPCGDPAADPVRRSRAKPDRGRPGGPGATSRRTHPSSLGTGTARAQPALQPERTTPCAAQRAATLPAFSNVSGRISSPADDFSRSSSAVRSSPLRSFL